MITTRDQTPRAARAFLVGVQVGKATETHTASLLHELRELVTTLDLEVADSLLVKIPSPHAKFFVGSGKAEEIIERAKTAKADLIIFDNELTPGQQRNWDKASGLSVIDREEVILEIFGRRAQTHEARLQVKLAFMEYSLPRLKRAWTHLSRQQGLGGKGEGETQLETDRRLVRKRIEKLKEELETVRAQRATQRKQRQRLPTPVVAIVGYTNAGKSSLLKKLTGAEVLVEDKLFATLDTTTRKIQLPNQQNVLLTDTVGFVRQLPHKLVEAFKATLEEATMADFLVHVLDVNNPEVLEFHQTTLSVLKELGADTKPTLTVFNKIDLAPSPEQLAHIQQQFPNALFISTHTGEGLQELLHRMSDLLNPELKQIQVLLPHSRYDLITQLYRQGKVLNKIIRNEGIEIIARISRRWLASYEPFLMPLSKLKKAA
jgi:GTP-binding protein HflX